MRDKVLCKGWADIDSPSAKEPFFLYENGYLLVLQSSFALVPGSVPFSIGEVRG